MSTLRPLPPAAAALAAALVFSSSPVAAETVRHQDRRSFPAPAGGAVRVDVSFSDIEVRVRPGATVEVAVEMEVTADGRKAQEYLDASIPLFEARGDEIVIRTGPQKKTWKFNWGSMQARGSLRIEVPPGVNLDLDTASGACTVDGDLGEGTVEIDTASGDVQVRGATRDLRLDTASGGIRIELSRAISRVEASTASGDVFVSGPVGEADLDTASGDIEVSGLTGGARLDTASGDIVARWSRLEGSPEVRADAASGDVRLHFPRGTRVVGRLETASGRIESDFPGRFPDDGKDTFVFDGGDGAVRIIVDTASGDVVVAAEGGEY